MVLFSAPLSMNDVTKIYRFLKIYALIRLQS